MIIHTFTHVCDRCHAVESTAGLTSAWRDECAGTPMGWDYDPSGKTSDYLCAKCIGKISESAPKS